MIWRRGKTNRKRQTTGSWLLLIALCITIMQAAALAEAPAQSPQQIVAEMQDRAAQETEFLQMLRQSVHQERRTQSWAAKKEGEIWKSYEAAREVPRGILKTVDCRTTQCEVLLEVNADSPETEVKQQTAIDEWAARSQPCAYTLSREEKGGAVHMFIRCDK